MEVLSSRILLRPADLARSQRFYRDVLGLAVYREFGSPPDPGVVFFLGNGFLEVSGRGDGPPGHAVMIWLQVRDLAAERVRLAASGTRIVREPVTEPWGLTEMWIEDPDGTRIVLVEVPGDHPLRRDTRLSGKPARFSGRPSAGRPVRMGRGGYASRRLSTANVTAISAAASSTKIPVSMAWNAQ